MSPQDYLMSFHRLKDDLPFGVDDAAAVAARFESWQHGRADAREAVALWVYLYLCRYFGGKFLHEGRRGASDLDDLFHETYGTVLARADQVREPERFPGWVSVVAQNAFRRYLRHGAAPVALADDYDPLDEDALDPLDGFDTPTLRAYLHHAVARLPDYLREVATKRLFEQADYETIAAAMGKDVAVVRSYTKKAYDRLRQDAGLRAVWAVD